jgi:hypothetical protein
VVFQVLRLRVFNAVARKARQLKPEQHERGNPSEVV